MGDILSVSQVNSFQKNTLFMFDQVIMKRFIGVKYDHWDGVQN